MVQLNAILDLTRSELSRWVVKPVLPALAATCGLLVVVGGMGMADNEVAGIAAGAATEETVSEFLHSIPFAGALFCAVLGVLIVTLDSASGHLSRLLLRSRSGLELAASKVLTAALLAVPVGAAALIAGHVTADIAMDQKGYAYQAPEDLVGWLARYLLHYVLAAVLGVGIGFLVRRTVVAVLVLFVTHTMLEPVVMDAMPDLARWLPGGAMAAVVRDPYFAEAFDTLPGVLIYFGWGILFLAAGVLLLRRGRIVSPSMKAFRRGSAT